MGKKAPASAPKPTLASKKAKAPAAAASAPPDQGELHDASTLLDTVPTEVFFALARARGATAPAPLLAPAPAPVPSPAPAVYVSDDDQGRQAQDPGASDHLEDPYPGQGLYVHAVPRGRNGAGPRWLGNDCRIGFARAGALAIN